MSPFLFQAAGIFGAGVLTSLSPCVYPMIPITVGYLGSNSDGVNSQRTKVISFFFGQVLAFTFLGVAAASLGEILGFSSEIPSVQLVTGLLLITMAIFSMGGKLPSFMSKWNQAKVFQTGIDSKTSKTTAFFQALLMGAVSALVASPCTSPVLGGVLASIAQAENLYLGTALMALYATGMSLIFLLLGLGLVNIKKLPRSGDWLNKLHKVSGVVLIAGGVYYVYQAFINW